MDVYYHSVTQAHDNLSKEAQAYSASVLKKEYPHLPDDPMEALQLYMKNIIPRFVRENLAHGPVLDFNILSDAEGNIVFRGIKVKVHAVARDTEKHDVFATEMGLIVITE